MRPYYLHRWPSARSMKRVHQRVKELTGSNRNGVKDVRMLISDLNPMLPGWGNCTGSAARKFNQLDSYVWKRLCGFLVTRYGPQPTGKALREVDSRVFLAARTAPIAGHRPLSGGRVTMRRRPSVSCVREGAADKATTQLVRVRPCHLSVSDMKRRHIPGRVTVRVGMV